MAARKYLNLKDRLTSSSSSSSNVAPSILLQTLTMGMISAPPPPPPPSHSMISPSPPSSSGQACNSGRDQDDARTSPPASPDNNSSSSSSSSLFIVKPPSPILSPLSPPTPLRNQPLSDKCTKILSSRKKSFLPPKSCSYLFKKGANKGEQCIRPCILNEVLCGLHLKSKEKSNTSHCVKQTAETLYTTRINRLRRFKKYFFVKSLEHATVIVRCEDKKYILRLPKGMINPKSPTEKHYLIRDSSGTAVWKKNKM